ncbi:MAG: hypothetical protein HZA54_10950 [Planctomycetes bacterium]|nr:hypothetical protein [Planctomycetota bacterium]
MRRVVAVVALLLGLLGLAPLASAQEDPPLAEQAVPAAEKSKELEMVVTAAPVGGGKLQVLALGSHDLERITWRFDGASVLAEFTKALEKADRVYSRVAGTRTIEKLLVSTDPATPLRVMECSFKMVSTKWIRSSDDWFLDTQKLQKTAAMALGFLAANKLDEALKVYLEAQKQADDMQYQADPFAVPGAGGAWGGVIDAIRKLQAASAEAGKGAGDVSELQALMTLQYLYRYAIPEMSPSLAPPASKDLDSLMKMTRAQAGLASQKLLSRLRKGDIKVAEAELAKVRDGWGLGMLSDLAYTFYMSGRYGDAYSCALHAILTKKAEGGTDWRRTLIQDLCYWIANDEKFAKGLPEAELKKMPGELKKAWEATRELDTLIAKDVHDALFAVKKRFEGVAWEPAMDPFLAELKPLLPPDEAEHGHKH